MNKTKEICQDCGRIFEAGPKGFLCPKCIKRRQSAWAKAHDLNRLGLEAQGKRTPKTRWMPLPKHPEEEHHGKD